jgi:transposase
MKWREMIGQFDPKKLVFIDESGTHLSYTRLYARAVSNERAIGSVPRNRGKVQTLIAALSVEGIKASMMIEGGTNGNVFITFVERCLVPKLVAGQVVVLDNLKAHQCDEVEKLIKAAGCELIYLPAYSPDFNPIENFFGWLKEKLRELEARVLDELFCGIGKLCKKLPLSAVLGWYEHCGYQV